MYFTHSNKVLDKIEAAVLKRYSQLIKESGAFGGIKVIGITGSVGKGEKRIVESLCNDIDFFIIADSCVIKKKKRIESGLRKISKTKFTDILFLRTLTFRYQIRKKRVDQYIFDLLKGSLILDSAPDFKRLFSEARNKKYEISSRSAAVVLLTRLWGLTGPYKADGGKILPLDFSLTSYQMKKALSAIVDAVLIFERLYSDPLTKAKIKNFRQTKFYLNNKKDFDFLLDVYAQEEKKDFEATYRRLVDIYLAALKYVYKKEINTIFDYPVRKTLLLSLVRSDERKRIALDIQRYKALKLIAAFYSSGDHSIADKLSYLFKTIFQTGML